MFIVDIEKDLIPYEFTMEFNNRLYLFTVKYNQENDYFTIDLSLDDEPLVDGEKILLGKELFSDYKHLDAPRDIIPLDISDNELRCGYEQLGNTVFLYLVGGLDEI